MSRQRTRHFAVALVLSAVLAAASAVPAVAGFTAPTRSADVISKTSTGIIQAPIATVTSHTSREVFGFALASSLSDPTVGYPSWNFDLLSTVSFFGVHVDATGHFAGDNGWTVWNSSALSGMVSVAHQHGTRVLLTVILQDFTPNTPSMCAGLNHADTTVAQAVSEVAAKHVDGVNIDYEGLDGACGTSDPYWAQHALNTFAQKMRAGLGSSLYLSIDTYAGAAADPYGFFDVAGLANYVDSEFVMAYDMEYSNYSSAPLYCSRLCLGPTSPLTGYRYNDTSVMGQYVAKVAASKVILGVPYYGRKACVANATSPNEYPTSSVVADSYLDASGEAAFNEVKPGSYVIHRESNSAGLERWDTWYNTTLNCTRELYWDDAVSLGKKYDLVNADGLRGVGLWNLNYGGGAPELWAALRSHFSACVSAAVTVSPASPQPPGAPVHLTATSTGCANPLYQLWILAPGRSWQIVQPYSPVSTFTWNTAGLHAGSYLYSVWARDSNSAGTSCNFLGCKDAFSPGAAYSLVTQPCTSVSDLAAPSSPQHPGTAVTFTAGASGCPHPLYQFWILAPGHSWQIVQPYSTASTFAWNTTGLPAGSYLYTVWARDSSSTGTACSSLGCNDAFFPGTAYALRTPCGSVTDSAAPAGPRIPGTTVTFTAGASGCPNPLYQFWILAPGHSWQIMQPYSAKSTFTWNTAGQAAGSYLYTVWARDAGSAGTSCSYLGCNDAFFPGTAYVLSPPCASVTDAAAPSAPRLSGTAVTFTASASGCSNPLYQFWILAPGHAWQIMQPYSTKASFTWTTTGLAPGSYLFTVWARDAGSPGTACSYLGCNDAFFPGTAYSLDSPCSAVSDVAAPVSPQTPGTTVTFTAVASGCSHPLYQFWILAPGHPWQVVQTYSASGTFRWNTAGLPAGSYMYTVWVRDAGSTGTSCSYLGCNDAFFPGTVYKVN